MMESVHILQYAMMESVHILQYSDPSRAELLSQLIVVLIWDSKELHPSYSQVGDLREIQEASANSSSVHTADLRAYHFNDVVGSECNVLHTCSSIVVDKLIDHPLAWSRGPLPKLVTTTERRLLYSV